jgi:XTP/dITP diphosphohydrolase
MKLIFATHNHNKAREIQAIMPEGIELLTLDEIQCDEEIPETAATLDGNAKLKAAYIAQQFDMECFADDTGLEVAALHGEPGVHSARYAGQSRDPEANMHLLLEKLASKGDRSAQFRTVIALYWNKEFHYFEGIVKGKILQEKKGNNGFGYDPIFEPENCGKSFAEMTLEEKNKYSHRSRALDKMIAFLSRQNVTN